MVARLLSSFLIVILLVTSGCAEFRTVPADPVSNRPYDVDVGDTVVVVTADDPGGTEFRIGEITDEGLGGEDVFFAYEEITLLKVSAIDGEETALSIMMGSVMALYIFMGVAAAYALAVL